MTGRTPKYPRRLCPGCFEEVGPQPRAPDHFILLLISQMIAENLPCDRSHCPVYLDWEVHVAQARAEPEVPSQSEVLARGGDYDQQDISERRNFYDEDDWFAPPGATFPDPFQEPPVDPFTIDPSLLVAPRDDEQQHRRHRAPGSPHVDLTGPFASIFPTVARAAPPPGAVSPPVANVVSDIDVAPRVPVGTTTRARARAQPGPRRGAKRTVFTGTEVDQIRQWRGEGVGWREMGERMDGRHSARSIKSKWRVMSGLRKPKST